MIDFSLNAKKIGKYYIIIFVPVIIFVFLISGYFIEIEKTKMLKLFEDEQEHKTQMINLEIERQMEAVIDDLLIIENAKELKNFINHKTTDNFQELEGLMKRMTRKRQWVDQLRYIDKDGYEKIRLNLNPDTKEHFFEKEEKLQYKGDRYYFKETKKLEEGQIYFSPMDLNVENNIIEKPIKPILRIAIPLYDQKNEFSGILITNYMAESLFEVIRTIQGFDEKQTKMLLLNKEGYFLYGSEGNDFAFMYEDKKNNTLKNIDHELWNRIIKKESGFKHQSRYYYSTYIYPIISETKTDKDYFWIMVYSFDEKEIPMAMESIYAVRNYTVIFFAALLLTILVLIVLRKNEREDNIIANLIAESTNEAFILTRNDTRIIYANKQFYDMTGYSKGEVIGEKPSKFGSYNTKIELYKKMWKTLKDKGIWTGEIWDEKKNGIIYPKILTIRSVYENNRKKKVRYYLGIFRDIKSKDTNSVINVGIKGDSQNTILSPFIDDIKDGSDNFIGIINIEINKLKKIRAAYGEESIKIIKRLSEMIIVKIKEVISQKDQIAQATKEEYLLRIVSCNNREELKILVDNLVGVLSKKFESFDIKTKLDIKVGISVYPEDDDNIRKVIRNSLIARNYIEKDSNRSHFFFEKKVFEKIHRELTIEESIPKAIEKEEFKMCYQPQIDILNQKTVALEALLRWDNHKFKDISPEIYINVAENTGQIYELGRWIIKNVFSTAKIIQNKNSNITVCINISPLQLKEPNFVEFVKKQIEVRQLDPRRIEFEITESTLIEEFEVTNDVLNSLKIYGISIAIDDFGKGFSSLNYLKSLKIDKLKIDRDFIKDYPNADDGTMIKTINLLGKSLNMPILAEGVETKKQLDYLKSINLRYVQGYFYSKPLDVEKVLEYIEKN